MNKKRRNVQNREKQKQNAVWVSRSNSKLLVKVRLEQLKLLLACETPKKQDYRDI